MYIFIYNFEPDIKESGVVRTLAQNMHGKQLGTKMAVRNGFEASIGYR